MTSASSNLQTVLRPTEYDLLLAHIIRSPGMASSVCRELEFLHLKEHGAPLANVVMYAVVKKFYKERNSSPDLASLEVELTRYMSEKKVSQDIQKSVQRHLDMFKALYPKVDSRSEGPVRDLAKKIIQARIIKPQVAALAQGYADGGSVQDLSARIKELEAKQMSVDGGRLMTGTVSRVVTDSGERIATGLPWIDPYLGGGRGPVLGCALAILAPQGGFKCLAPETPIRMFDGSVKRADSVQVGDQLMGPDSRPRNVLTTHSGRDEMFEIRPNRFDTFVCNSVHVLTLCHVVSHETIDVPLNEYLSETWALYRRQFKLFRAPLVPHSKDVQTDWFQAIPKGVGDYSGFTLDGDGRFLLKDFTVTHNTGNGIQMVVAQALQCRNSLLVLAEEGFTKNIQRRIWAYITKVKTSEIEACGDNLEEVVKKHGLDAAAIAKKLSAVDKHLHVLDLLQHPGDIGAITAEVEHMEAHGAKPMYVYVDWAGPIADRMISGAESGRKYEKKYDALKDLAFQLAQLAGRKNMILAVSHQMAAENVKKGPFAENDQYCAAECRSFTEQFKYVLTVNAKDPKTGLQLMNIAKARDDPNNVKVILRCDGATSTTTDVSSDFEHRGRKFIEKNRKANRLPTESTEE